MPRKHRLPSYRLHKPSGQAVVRIEGHDYYLGKHGTAESRLQYDGLIRDLLARRSIGLDPIPTQATLRPSVNEVLLHFWQHAERHYRKHGRTTSELANYRRVLKLLKRLYGTLDAAAFTPRCLAACQQMMVEEGLARKTINKHVVRIRSVFKWAVSQEMMPVETYMALTTVAGLQAGRTEAQETAPVPPVARKQVDAILPYLSPQVVAIVELLWYSGARPGEVVLVRMADLDTSESTWCYVPSEHKVEHFDKQRRIWLGPQCQRIIIPFRKADPEAYLFSPAEAIAERLGYTPKRTYQLHYSTRTLRDAIGRACDRAGIDRWMPNQLRHARATEIDRKYGREAASVVLGHAKPDMTAIYTARNEELARKIASECG